MSNLGHVDGNTTIVFKGKSMKYSEFLKMPRGDTMICRSGSGLLAVDKKKIEQGVQLVQEMLFSNGASSSSSSSLQLRPEYSALDPDGRLVAGVSTFHQIKNNFTSPEEVLRRMNQDTSESENDKLVASVWEAVSNRIDELEEIQMKRNVPKSSEQTRGMFNPMTEIKFAMNAELQKVVEAAKEEFKRVIKEEYLIPNGKKMSPNGNRKLMLEILEKAHPGLFSEDQTRLIRLNDENPYFEKPDCGDMPSSVRDAFFWFGLGGKVMEKMAKDKELFHMIGEVLCEFDENDFGNDARNKMMAFKNRRAWAFEGLEKRFPGMFEISEQGQIEFK